MMQLLRNNIHIYPLADAQGCELFDELDQKTYEFGEIEHFLLKQVQKPYRIDEVVASCNEHFDENLNKQDVVEFFDLLEQWKLLDDHQEPPNNIPENTDVKAEEVLSSERNGQPSSALKQELQQPNRWHLFNPQRLFDYLNRVLFPVYKLLWLTPFIFALGFMTVLSNMTVFLVDLSSAITTFGMVGRILLAAVTINQVSQIARGIVARYFHLDTPSFGLMLVFGLMPRFNVQVKNKEPLDRATRLWLCAILPAISMLIFGIAAVLWGTTRSSGTLLSAVCVELVFLSTISFVISTNPFMPVGANLFSTWLDIPNLRKRSLRAVVGLFIRQPDVIKKYSKKNRMSFALFGFLSIIFLVCIVSFISHLVFTILENKFQGAGVALFLFLVVYISWNIRRQKMGHSSKKKRVQHKPSSEGINFQEAHNFTSRAKSAIGNRLDWQRRLKQLFFLMLLVLVLMLPYQYETGGAAEVFPIAKATVASETSGIIGEVYVKDSDWVEAGTKLARMSYYRQQKDVAVMEATIKAKQFEIQQLLTTPSQEEKELAGAVLKMAELQFEYSLKELKRLTPLYKKGYITLTEYEDSKKESDFLKQGIEEAKLSLNALLKQVNPNQIEALKVEIEKLGHEVKFYNEELENTYLISPIQGQIIGENLQFKKYSYIGTGDVFVEIENSRTVSVRIEVPESDISDAKLGSKVNLKLWAYPDIIFTGKVDEIDPSTAEDETQYGRIIYVESHIENPDGLLISGLSGYAKITSGERPIIFAFSRAFMRFLRVEVWSWLP